jgi:16S rRNA (guanine966-N2)-methyltransferase
MRIVAGHHRSRRLVVPPGKGVRPTSDRAREAIFSSLGAVVVGARVLDLFAGSGAMGLEALSRGAAHCRFVERDAQALAAIDPPYEAVPKLAATLADLLPQALAPGGRVVLETAAGDGFDVPGLVERYNRRIAAARIVILGAA